MKRSTCCWVGLGSLWLAACHEELPCLTIGAVRVSGLCTCPDGEDVEEQGDGTQACASAGDRDGASTARDGATSRADAEVRDARVTQDARAADAEQPPPDDGDHDAGAITNEPEDASQSAPPDASQSAPPDAGHAVVDAATPPTCTKNACGVCGAVPVEVCDGIDNDCDGTTDEGCMFYYKDCDADGFAVNATGRVFAMSAPVSLTDCLGWTTKQPVDDNSTDCDDARKTRYPGAPAGLPISSPGETLPPAGDPAWDLNCDGMAIATFPLTTGQVANGQPVPIECQEAIDSCVQQVNCVDSWNFSGIPSCGVGYPANYVCGGSGTAYYECK